MICQPMSDAKITSPYGMRVLNGKEQFHDGIDMVPGNDDWNIYSVGPGTVCYDFDAYNRKVAWTDPRHSGGIYCIVLTELNDNQYYFKYVHMEHNNVYHGQKIPAGYIIGRMGNTGQSFGAHLHLSIYDLSWKVLDPMTVLNGG